MLIAESWAVNSRIVNMRARARAKSHPATSPCSPLSDALLMDQTVKVTFQFNLIFSFSDISVFVTIQY